jgi:large subunit ribosomal protein L23
MSKTMILRPRISEKSYGLSQLRNTYAFDVPTNANRTEVADAVAAQFEVTVLSVNILNSKGKVKRTIRRGGRPVMGKRADTKKAYVTLKAGDELPIFAAVEDTTEAEPKPDQQQKKGKK